MKRIYCTDTQESIPLEHFAAGKAIWCGGKPYLIESAVRLHLSPDPQPPREFADLLLPKTEIKPAPKPAGPLYCTSTQERLYPENFAQGKAVMCGGKPYLAIAAKRLGLKPDVATAPVQVATPPPASPPPKPVLIAPAIPKVVYCANTQERIPPEYFAEGKAVWKDGKAYIVEARKPEPPVIVPQPDTEPAVPKVIYCARTQERIPPEYFTQGKAIWKDGKGFILPPGAVKPPEVAPSPPKVEAPLPKVSAPPKIEAPAPVIERKPAPRKTDTPPPLPAVKAEPKKVAVKTPEPEAEPAAAPEPSEPPPPQPRRWRRRILIASGVLAALLAIAVTGALLYFNDNYFRDRLVRTIRAETGRVASVESLHVSYWNGAFELKGFKLLNAVPSEHDSDALRVASVKGSFAKWAFLFSGFKKLQEVKLEAARPEVLIERLADGSVNFDDLIARFTSGPGGAWPRATGLQGLQFDLSVADGEITLRDSAGSLGVSKFSNIKVDANHVALGQPTPLAVSFDLQTPRMKESGRAEFKAQVNWIDAGGVIDPAALNAITLTGTLKDIDAGHLARFAGVEGKLANGTQHWILGAAWSGTVQFDAPNLSAVKFDSTLRSANAVCIREGENIVADNCPVELRVKAEGAWSSGALQLGMLNGDVRLAPTLAQIDAEAQRTLQLSFDSAPIETVCRKVNWSLRSRSGDVLSMNVPKAFGLDDQMAGNLTGQGHFILRPGAKVDFDTKLQLSEGFVKITGFRQPANWQISANGRLLHDGRGVPKDAGVNFRAKTPSWEVASKTPLMLNNLGDLDKLSAEGDLTFNVRGQEFWTEFGQLLAQANLGVPLKEALEGEIKLRGNRRSAHFELDGTLQQQADQPAPIGVAASGDLELDAYGRAEKPWLSLDAKVKSAAEDGLDIGMKIFVAQNATQRTIDVSDFFNRGQLNALNDLNARFGAYARVFLGPKYKVFGVLEQTGHSRLVQTLEDGRVTGSTVTLTTAIQLERSRISGPALTEKGPPLDWAENKLDLKLGMRLTESAAGSRVTIEQVDFTSDSLAIKGTFGEADVARLKNAMAGGIIAVRHWADALPATTVTARASADAIKRLQHLGIFPNEVLLAGNLDLSAAYNPQTRLATVDKLAFTGAAADAQLVSGPLSVDTLATLLEANERSLQKWSQALPQLDFNLKLHPVLLNRLKVLEQYVTQRATTSAELVLRGQFDAATRHAKLDPFAFNGPDFGVSVAAANANIPAIAGLLDAGSKSFEKWAEVLPDLSFTANIANDAVKHLQASGYWLNEPLAVGKVELKGQYLAQTRQAQFENVLFENADTSVQAQMQNFDVPELAKLLETPGPLFSNWVPVLPDLKFQAAAKPAAVARLQQLKILPADNVLQGDVAARGVFNKATQQWQVDSITFKSPAIEVSLSAPAIDVKGMLKFLETAATDAGQALRLFGDVVLDVAGSEQIFAPLRARKLIPEHMVIEGKVKLRARYEKEPDRLTLERLAYTATSPASPLTSIELAGTAESVSRVLEQPVLKPQAFFDAFKDGIRVQKAVLAPAEWFKVLKKEFPAATWLDDCLNGVYRFEGPLTLDDLVFKPAKETGVYFASFTAHTKSKWHPRPAPDQPPQQVAAATVDGALKVAPGNPLRIDLNLPRLNGRIDLTESEIAWFNPYHNYQKARSAPCTLAVDAALKEGSVLQAASVELAGGPLPLSVTNLSYDFAAPKLKASVGKALITLGTQTVALADAAVDIAADKVRGALSCSTLDLRQLGLKTAPERLNLTGTLNNIQCSYDGRISALSGGFTTADKLALRCQVKDFAANSTAERGRTVLLLGGDLGVETGRLFSQGLGARVEFTTAGGEMFAHAFAFTLDATSKDPNLTLLDAARQDGLPLLVKSGVRFDTPLDLDRLQEALNVIVSAATGGTAGEAGTGGLDKVKQLRVEAGLTAPAFKYDDLDLRNISTELVVMDELKVYVRNAKAGIFGGEVQIAEANYDLTTNPITHAQNVNFSNLSLAALMGEEGKAPEKDKYQVFARLSGNAGLSGQGIRREDRRTWQGSANVGIADLVALKNGGQAGGGDIGKAFIGGLGSMIGGGLGRAAMFYSANFGLFLNRLEFENTQVQAQVQAGKVTVFRSFLTGKGTSAGLQFGFGGDIDLPTQKFAPLFYVWPTVIPESTQRAMGLMEIDANERQQVLNYMREGYYYVTFKNSIADKKMDDSVIMNLLGWIEGRIQARKAPVQTQNAINAQDWANLINNLTQPQPKPAQNNQTQQNKQKKR